MIIQDYCIDDEGTSKFLLSLASVLNMILDRSHCSPLLMAKGPSLTSVFEVLGDLDRYLLLVSLVAAVPSSFVLMVEMTVAAHVMI